MGVMMILASCFAYNEIPVAIVVNPLQKKGTISYLNKSFSFPSTDIKLLEYIARTEIDKE